MNPARLAAFRLRAQKEVFEKLSPATIKLATRSEGFDGKPALVASVGSLRRGEKHEDVSFLDTDDIAFRVRKELLPEMPTVGLRVLWVERALTFRLEEVRDTGDTDPAWRLSCKGLHE